MMTTPEKISADLFESWQVTGKMRELSFTGLKEFMKSPAKYVEYLTRKENQERDDWKEYFSSGHLFEFFFLNGDDADPSDKFYIANKSKMPMPSADFRTKANKEWLNEEQANAIICGKIFCFFEQVENARKQAKACVYEKTWHYKNAKSMYQFHAHGKIFGVPFHGHIDLIVEINGQKIIYDTKCTGKNLDSEKSARYYITDAKTHIQMLIYKQLSNASVCKVIISESNPPYNFFAFELNQALDWAYSDLEKACENYKKWYAAGCPIANNSFFETQNSQF